MGWATCQNCGMRAAYYEDQKKETYMQPRRVFVTLEIESHLQLADIKTLMRNEHWRLLQFQANVARALPAKKAKKKARRRA